MSKYGELDMNEMQPSASQDDLIRSREIPEAGLTETYCGQHAAFDDAMIFDSDSSPDELSSRLHTADITNFDVEFVNPPSNTVTITTPIPARRP